MANIITGIRIVLSIALMFCPALSPSFYALYIVAGFSDMIDGAVARKTGTVSEFGSRLDTGADIVFVAVFLIKLLPVLHIPVWLYQNPAKNTPTSISGRDEFAPCSFAVPKYKIKTNQNKYELYNPVRQCYNVPGR
jgi:hypothetical protein